MGCRCTNSTEEEFEINKRDLTGDNLNNNEGIDMNNRNNHLNNNDYNSEKTEMILVPIQKKQIIKKIMNLVLILKKNPKKEKYLKI